MTQIPIEQDDDCDEVKNFDCPDLYEYAQYVNLGGDMCSVMASVAATGGGAFKPRILSV